MQVIDSTAAPSVTPDAAPVICDSAPPKRAAALFDAAPQPAPARVPFTQAQLRRLYDNSPEICNDVRSRYGFYRVAMLVEKAHGITQGEPK